MIFIVSVAAATDVAGDSAAVEVVVSLIGDGDDTLNVLTTVVGVGVMFGCVLLVVIGRDVVVVVVVVVVSDCDIVRVVDVMGIDAGDVMVACFALVVLDGVWVVIVGFVVLVGGDGAIDVVDFSCVVVVVVGL